MFDDKYEADHMIPLDEFDDHEIHGECKCNPEYVVGEDHTYWRHFRMRPVDAIDYLADISNINLN
jgi:hypothetical protein